jgi:hypothetical protein
MLHSLEKEVSAEDCFWGSDMSNICSRFALTPRDADLTHSTHNDYQKSQRYEPMIGRTICACFSPAGFESPPLRRAGLEKKCLHRPFMTMRNVSRTREKIHSFRASKHALTNKHNVQCGFIRRYLPPVAWMG